MPDHATTWALVPIKDFAEAKSRLAPALSEERCAELAACMAADVITALRGCSGIELVACLGAGPHIRAFAAEHDCRFIEETPEDGLLANLDRAARELQGDGAQTLLIVPGDLPTITSADLDTLLNTHRGGLTICPAARDGGTNALVVSPPTGIGFLFGEQSCRRHLRAAEAAGLEHRVVQIAAFDFDIDRPVDLAWLCSVHPHGRTGEYLDHAGICGEFEPAANPLPSAASA